ncbi:TadA family conjugal transfer-associated ATPase [Humibacter antri]
MPRPPVAPGRGAASSPAQSCAPSASAFTADAHALDAVGLPSVAAAFTPRLNDDQRPPVAPQPEAATGPEGRTRASVIDGVLEHGSGEGEQYDDGAGSLDRSDWSAFGPLAPYVAAPGVTDVFVNGPDGLWVDVGAGAVHDPTWSCEERSLRLLAVRLVALGGRHVDEAHPCVDVRLAEGIRVHVVLPPVSTGGTLISIRVPRPGRFSLDELDSVGMLASHRGRLEAAVRQRANLLVTGAAGSGKTTLLSALLAEAPPHERIVCIEDVAELHVRHPHVVAMEARQANLEGAGAIGLDRLVREALRMRPDRLVVGECRGAEVRDLMSALNTGHDGGAGTLHANSIDDVPARLEALGALAEMDASAVARQAVSAFDLVVHLERVAGIRRVAHCGSFRIDAAGRLVVQEARER